LGHSSGHLVSVVLVFLLVLGWSVPVGAIGTSPVLHSAPNQVAGPPTFSNWAEWHAYMSHNPAPRSMLQSLNGGGCFEANYPSTTWQEIPCVAAVAPPNHASKGHEIPSHTLATVSMGTETVGNGNDWVAVSPAGTLIGSATGSFPSVTGLTSETDVCVGPPPFCTVGGAGHDAYGLQVNTEFPFPVTFYGKATTGWQQFIYSNAPSGGAVWIEYWLMGYHASYLNCPDASENPPGESGNWFQAGTDCVFNTAGVATPYEPITSLSSLSLEAYANLGSNDGAQLCVSGGSCYLKSLSATVLNLYLHWHQAEFNIVGLINGSQAQFNLGTSITVLNALMDQSGNPITPSCIAGGYTGETNNLNLVAGTCSSSSAGIVFLENNLAPQTLTTSVSPPGSGTVSPSCPSGCAHTPGEPITVTANWILGTWDFESWTITGASCSAGSTTNPCSFTMPDNPVSVTAVFTYIVDFNQVGIPSGVTWGVTVGGTRYTSTSGLVTVPDLSGTVAYSYDPSVPAPGGGSYICAGCSGSVSGPTTVTATYTYSVTFQQVGVPGGVTWGVTVGGTRYTSTTSSVTRSGLSGTVAYSYDPSVPAPGGGSYICVSGCSGSVTGPTTVTATYQPQLVVTLVGPLNGGTVSIFVPISVHVTGPGGRPVSGATVMIYVNGAPTTCSGKTDWMGNFNCYYRGFVPRTYTWYATASKTGSASGTSPTWTFRTRY
jgi:hypothetical protein